MDRKHEQVHLIPCSLHHPGSYVLFSAVTQDGKLPSQAVLSLGLVLKQVLLAARSSSHPHCLPCHWT